MTPFQGTRKGMPLLYDEEASQAAPCIVGATLAVALASAGAFPCFHRLA